MASDDDSTRQIEELQARILELMAQLRIVTAERDDARREVDRLRGAGALENSSPETAGEDVSIAVELCAFCDGEGVYWVHDFEMQCKRCNGSGQVRKGSAAAVPDRH